MRHAPTHGVSRFHCLWALSERRHPGKPGPIHQFFPCGENRRSPMRSYLVRGLRLSGVRAAACSSPAGPSGAGGDGGEGGRSGTSSPTSSTRITLHPARSRNWRAHRLLETCVEAGKEKGKSMTEVAMKYKKSAAGFSA